MSLPHDAHLGPMRFTLLAQDGAARRGRLEFPRGTVETPAFMPVGTYGTVKAMTPEDLEDIGAEIVLGNTFHLYLRPGLEVIAAHQGLHRFMHWRRPILTDSGGFQVWSLAEMRKITEEGAHFRSPVDGAQVFLSPEESMRIQRTLASDVAMSFDECTPYPATESEARVSMELSMRWALRGFREYYRTEPPGTLFGIVQGGIYPDLRAASLAVLEEIGFAGLAVGGLAVGESEEQRDQVLDGLMR
jgi:queuine tRNA-ribosyltransferase